jgi:hypothetical protein
VSHTGAGMLREVADLTGLSVQVTAALADAYRGPWTHAPGDMFAESVRTAVGESMTRLRWSHATQSNCRASSLTIWRFVVAASRTQA